MFVLFSLFAYVAVSLVLLLARYQRVGTVAVACAMATVGMVPWELASV